MFHLNIIYINIYQVDHILSLSENTSLVFKEGEMELHPYHPNFPGQGSVWSRVQQGY